MTTENPDLNGPEHFTGHPNNKFVKDFREIMVKQRRGLTADQTIAAFVRAKLPVWLAEQTLAGLTLAMRHVVIPPRRGKAMLSVIDGGKSK